MQTTRTVEFNAKDKLLLKFWTTCVILMTAYTCMLLPIFYFMDYNQADMDDFFNGVVRYTLSPLILGSMSYPLVTMATIFKVEDN